MREILAVVLAISIAVILMASLAFGGRYLTLAMNTFFSPKEEALKTKVFKETQQYADGMASEFGRLRMEYEKATTEGQRNAIIAMVRHESASVNLDRIPPELRAWVVQIRGY